MSKKRFLEALHLARAGKTQEALQILELLERGFVRRRLAHYRDQPDHREAAIKLAEAFELAAGGRAEPASDEAQTFEAPLSPGFVGEAPRGAVERTPKRAADRWLVFGPADNTPVRIRVRSVNEDTPAAAGLAQSSITPAILARQTVELDFSGLEICTQSWLHALLFESVRLAWALRVPIHVVHADPAVREGLRFLEAYALGG